MLLGLTALHTVASLEPIGNELVSCVRLASATLRSDTASHTGQAAGTFIDLVNKTMLDHLRQVQP